MIYVTVGTHHHGFPRLIQAIDAYAAEHSGEVILVQTGFTTTLPEHCEHFDFKPREACLRLHRDARVIVCHGGIGAVMDALESGRPFVVVPRRKAHGEHNSDHQLELARAVEARGWGRVVRDVEMLGEALANPLPPPEGYRPRKEALVGAVRRFVANAAGNR